MNMDERMLREGKHLKIILPEGMGEPLYTNSFTGAKLMAKEYGKGTQVIDLKKQDYRKMIGDGKTPNIYFVFHYDQKFHRNIVDGVAELEAIEGDLVETSENFLGSFYTFREALKCIDDKSYLPHKIIEDRLAGVLFEGYFIVCPCCGHEEWEQRQDTAYTEKVLKARGFEFE